MSFRITFQQLVDLRCGIVKKVRVGVLEPHIAGRIGAIYARDVWLSTESYHHILTGHEELTYHDLELIPSALEHGRIIFDKRREQHLTIEYLPPPLNTRRFVLAVKANKFGNAVYVRSFHLLTRSRSLARRGYMMREHQ